jgi:GTPase SAR1 family protein
MAEILDASLDGLSLNNILTSVEFQALLEMNVRHAHGFFLVCSMDKDDSIKNLETIITLIYSTKDTKPGSLPMILVINKSDKRNQRVLSENEINDFLERHKIQNCLETSAYSYQNINVAFDTLIGETYNSINDLNRIWTKIANGERPSSKKKNKCSIG